MRVSYALILETLAQVLFGSEADREIPGRLEGQPAARHARRNLEQIRYDTFVQSSRALMLHDRLERVTYALVLVAHSRHGVDLEATSEHITDSTVSFRSSSSQNTKLTMDT